jgi:hypothetical protein
MTDHAHTNGSRDYGNAIKLGITINLAFIATEVYFGFRSGSMALVADAGHNFGDVLSMEKETFRISKMDFQAEELMISKPLMLYQLFHNQGLSCMYF